MIASLFNKFKRYLSLAGGTMDSNARIDWPNETVEKMRLWSTTYGIAINSSEFTIFLGNSAELRLRDDSGSGTIRGTVWHSGNDGAGSGLDAGVLAGASLAEAATASTVVKRDVNADINARLFRSNWATQASALNASDDMAFRRDNGSDNYIRFAERAVVIAWLNEGGIGGVNTAYYRGSCDGSGFATDVTITSVTTTQAAIAPLIGLVEELQVGVNEMQLLNSTTVRLFHSNNYSGRYAFVVRT